MTVLDVEQLVAEHQSPPTVQCRTCRWLDSRPADERPRWEAVLSDRKRWRHAAIHRAMLSVSTDDSPPLTRGSIENHRQQAHRSRP